MKNSNLRRYPALSYLVAAGALALLLPSALTLPRSGPQTLAEYAPVTGDGEGTADLGELASASSGGPGFGAGKRTGALADETEQKRTDRFIRKAGTKRCVGNPPRQTEDPLSPPCIAFFEGDNGGATAKGVTRDEVHVVVRLENTNLNDGVLVDCADPPEQDEPARDLLCKAYMRYFNERYQTWNRTIHLWSSHDLPLSEVESRKGPFAYVATTPTSSASTLGMVSVGYGGTQRPNYAKNAPRYISFQPDQEDRLAQIVNYVCRFKDKPARFSGTPTDVGRKRVFGLWSTSLPNDRVKELLRSTCGIEIAAESDDYKDASAPSRFQAVGVTTVIAGFADTGHATATGAATNSGYFPEWLIAGWGTRSFDTNTYGRLGQPNQWRNAFGITFDYRRDAISEQPWYRAYREGCPDCPDFTLASSGGSFAPYAYDAVQLLFYGIQSAGPKLSAETVDRGLHTVAKDRSTNPYKPAAYFDDGNWSFMKDAVEIKWDPSGQAPGSAAAGCYRLPGGGNRYRAWEWPDNDTTLDAPGPCQGDAFQ